MGYRFKRQKKIASIFLVKIAGSEIELLPEAVHFNILLKPPSLSGYGRRRLFNMKKIIKMREMSDNQKGIIKKISATGDMGRRIREMGLVPETVMQVQGRAPLKDPVAIKIRDFVLTLRNNEAGHILVAVDTPDSPRE